MTIDLKKSYILQTQIKRAVNDLCRAVMSDIDKNKELNIVKRGFEIQIKDNKKYRVILSIEERW